MLLAFGERFHEYLGDFMHSKAQSDTLINLIRSNEREALLFCWGVRLMTTYHTENRVWNVQMFDHAPRQSFINLNEKRQS